MKYEDINLFKFFKKLIERMGPTAPMPIVAPPVVPSEAATTPLAIPTIAIGEDTKPKRSPRNQPKPSVRRRPKKFESDPT